MWFSNTVLASSLAAAATACVLPPDTPSNNISEGFAIQVQNATYPIIHNRLMNQWAAELRGKAFIAHNLLHDLAALDKKELLLWEEWGTRVEYNTKVPEAEERMLNEVAAVTQHQDVKIGDVKEFLAKEGLAIPTTVMLYDPYTDDAPKPEDISRVLKE
ncbi:hypothetical protein NLG97_g4405 [Lecanicillium saksenae]|uniref:Uncharacterized protein n=1 Tax=Lecanicillium saksenae TaxID=468837 RepID=A0ACC1QX38_9HYPO|nr:hypothetical protein NLG97_g4405 [Lecanicillium saksenae]